MIARAAAKAVLAKAYASDEPALVSVVGRRRVGKTFLVRQVYARQIAFQVAGLARATRAVQLANFERQLRGAFPTWQPIRGGLRDWLTAFGELGACLEAALSATPSRRVVFLDELPWLASARSGFLQAFAWFWNSWAYDRRVVVVICGSAASWMIRKVVRDRGALHNRITHRIRLRPFTLPEASAYLDSRGIAADRYQRLQLYLALGGVPYYLKLLAPGGSAQTEIDRLIFARDAPLAEEFSVLFASLFDRPERHLAVVRALGTAPGGLTRDALARASGLSPSGGLTSVLEELELSGFVDRSRPYESKRKGSLTRLADEFSAFYLRWVEPASPTTASFHRVVESPAYRAWAGLAYERLGLKHVDGIRRALGISGVDTFAASYTARAKGDLAGVQVDLLLDRADRTITLVEAKFATDAYVLTKAYAEALRRKVSLFRQHTGTRKHVQLVLLTTYGLRDSPLAAGVIDRVLTLDDLFAPSTA